MKERAVCCIQFIPFKQLLGKRGSWRQATPALRGEATQRPSHGMACEPTYQRRLSSGSQHAINEPPSSPQSSREDCILCGWFCLFAAWHSPPGNREGEGRKTGIFGSFYLPQATPTLKHLQQRRRTLKRLGGAFLHFLALLPITHFYHHTTHTSPHTHMHYIFAFLSSLMAWHAFWHAHKKEKSSTGHPSSCGRDILCPLPAQKHTFQWAGQAPST